MQAAARAQRELAGHHWPVDAPVLVRMGVHSGEGVVSGGDYVGLDNVGSTFTPFFTQTTAADPANEYYAEVSP